MGTAAKRPRANRTITVAFRDAAPSCRLLEAGQAFGDGGLACGLALGLQRKPQATCNGAGGLTRPSLYTRVRRGGVTIGRVQWTWCTAVFTVLPPCV